MSFTIPNIPHADPTIARPSRGTSPNKSTFERFIDLERSIATKGRNIWSFIRNEKTDGEPTSPFTLKQDVDVWMPFCFFPHRIPYLGAGEWNPTKSDGPLGLNIWMIHDGDPPALRLRVFNTITTGLETKEPVETSDSNDWSRWVIEDLDETIVVPNDMCLFGLEFNTDGTSDDTLIWGMGLYWLNIQDIEP
jgi:hypothetical protein